MKYVLLLSFLLSACASYEVTPGGRILKTESEYFQIIEENSDSTRRYSGLYNLIDMEATIMNTKVVDAQLDQLTRIYLWDDKKIQDERAKAADRLNKETEFFLAFFTPDRKDDDVSKPKTVWKVFLDAGGHRYEGKVSKVKTQYAHLIALYPYHNRFYSPYQVTFPVPMRSLEGKELKMTVTGAVGSGVLNFKP